MIATRRTSEDFFMTDFQVVAACDGWWRGRFHPVRGLYFCGRCNRHRSGSSVRTARTKACGPAGGAQVAAGPDLMRPEQLVSIARTVVAAAQRRLPVEIRPLARAVPVSYEPVPNDAIRAEGWEPDILGLFVGHAHHGEHADLQPLPPQILLFLENIWDYAEEDVELFRDEVRLTYLHELGHYLGWDEDEIARRGLD
jgi:predicted Zn-dependent protease with MMP-like domain